MGLFDGFLKKENNKKTTGRENKTTKDAANKAVTNSVNKPAPPPHVKPTTSSAAKSASKPSANLQPLKKSVPVPKIRAVPPNQATAASRVPSRIPPNVRSNALLNGEKRGGVGGSGREGGAEKEEGKRWFFGRRNSKDSRDGGGRGRNEIKAISKSTTCLNNNTIDAKKQANGIGKPRRPSSVVESQNITLRRGGGQSSNKNADLNQPLPPGSLSRTSSVNDINSHQDPGKSSRDRLDRIAGEKGKDKKALSKNNNKIESDEPSGYQSDRQELEILQRQLQEMANEKTNLALQLGEHKGQLATLQNEIAKLKMFQDQSNSQLEQLTEENGLLRNRLRDVAHSPLSDNEKQQLLYESHRHHSSAPASIATNVMDEHNGGDITTCPTPEWDKQSSGNVSEISVACLQDKINQMQETHYSTHEELQATLQELTDLQRQLLDHQHLTARLTEEKTLMFDSLCRQTERLTDARREVDALRHVLYSSHSGPDGIEQGQAREAEAEREEREAWLQEREELVQERERATRDAEEAGRKVRELDGEVSGLRERVGTLEGMVEAGRDERRRVERELAEARDEASGKVIEMDRLRDLLDIARTKITELEQDRTLSDKSELDELLDNTRKEKDALEAEVADLREQLARSKNETEKLREQVSILQEECKVIRNNAKTTQSDLEYKNEKLLFEKTALTEQLQQFQDAVDELQVQSQCQSEDKRQLSAVLSETQRNLSESERKIQSLEDELGEVQKLRKEENEEWEKFQNDLLTSVRVANDFKTEAQQDLQKMIMENKAHRDRVRQLESQIDKLKGISSMKNEATTTMKSRSKSSDDLTRIKTGQRNVLVVTDVKKRDRSLKKRREKALSREEKQILSQLDELYREIDVNVPSDRLNDEQKAIRDLKMIYDSEMTNRKPVAPTSKDKLAISKPLLRSVYENPKLQSIATDPRFITVEEIEPIDDDDNLDSAVNYKSRASNESLIIKYKASPWRSSDRKSSNNLHKVRSEYFPNQNEYNDDYMEKQLTKSYSCDEIFSGAGAGTRSDYRAAPQGLLRLSSTEQLNNYDDTRVIDKARASTAIDKPFYSENSLNLLLRSSSSSSNRSRSDDITIVKPRATASKTSLETIDLNPEPPAPVPAPLQQNKTEDKSHRNRFISRISLPKVKLSFLNKKPAPIKEIKNDYNVTFETLEEICQDIDPNADDEKLSKEQLFAKKLLLSLNEFGRKGTLKRIAKVRKQKIVISSPIQRSTVITTDNPKLLSVIKDPEPDTDRRPEPRSRKNKNSPFRHSLYSALENCEFEEEEPKERLYKSYDDINFTFDREKGLRSPINMYSDEDLTKVNVKSSDNSSSSSTTSGEFFVNKEVNETVNKRIIMRTFSVGSDGEKSFQRVELSGGRFIFEVDRGDEGDRQSPAGEQDPQAPVVIFDKNLELDVNDIEDVKIDVKVEVHQNDDNFEENVIIERKICSDLKEKSEEIDVEDERNEEIAAESNKEDEHRYNKAAEDKSAEEFDDKFNEELQETIEDRTITNEIIEGKSGPDLKYKSEEIDDEDDEEIILNMIIKNNEEKKDEHEEEIVPKLRHDRTAENKSSEEYVHKRKEEVQGTSKEKTITDEIIGGKSGPDLKYKSEEIDDEDDEEIILNMIIKNNEEKKDEHEEEIVPKLRHDRTAENKSSEEYVHKRKEEVQGTSKEKTITDEIIGGKSGPDSKHKSEEIDDEDEDNEEKTASKYNKEDERKYNNPTEDKSAEEFEDKFNEELQETIEDRTISDEIIDGKSDADLEHKSEETEDEDKEIILNNEETASKYNKEDEIRATEDKSTEEVEDKFNEELAETIIEEKTITNEIIEGKSNADLNNKSEEIAPMHTIEEITFNNEESKSCEENKDEHNEATRGEYNKEDERKYNNGIEESVEEIGNKSDDEVEDNVREALGRSKFEDTSNEEIENKRECDDLSDNEIIDASCEEELPVRIEEIQEKSEYEDKSSEDINTETPKELQNKFNDVIFEDQSNEDSNEEFYEDSYEEIATETDYDCKSEFAQEGEFREEIEDRFPGKAAVDILLPEEKYIDYLFAPIDDADGPEESYPGEENFEYQYNENDAIDYKLQKYGAFSEEEEEEYEKPLGVHAAYKSVVEEMKKRCSDAKKPEISMGSSTDSEEDEEVKIFDEESKREIEDFIENERIISSISDENFRETRGLTSSEKDLLECVNQRYSVVSEMNESDWEFVDEMRKKYQARDGDDEFYVPIDDRLSKRTVEDDASLHFYENVSSESSDGETYCDCNVPDEFQTTTTGDCNVPNNYPEMTDDDSSNNEKVKVIEQNFSTDRDMESSTQNTTTELIDSNIRAIFNGRLTNKLDDESTGAIENGDGTSDSAPTIRAVKKFSSLFQELPQAREMAFGFVPESNGSSNIIHDETSPINDSNINLFRPGSETSSLDNSSLNVKVFEDLNGQRCKYNVTIASPCEEVTTIKRDVDKSDTIKFDEQASSDSMTKVSRLKSIFESKSKETDLQTKSDTKPMDCKVSSGAIPKTTRSRLHRPVDSDDSLGSKPRSGRRDYDAKGSFTKARKVFERLEDHRGLDASKFYPEVPVEGSSKMYRQDSDECLGKESSDGNVQFMSAVDSVEIHEGKMRERNDGAVLQEEGETSCNLQPIREDNSAGVSCRNYKRKIILTEDDRVVVPQSVVVDKSLSSTEQFEKILEAVKKDSLKKVSSNSSKKEDEEVTGNDTFRKEEQLNSGLFEGNNRDPVIGNLEGGNPVEYDYDINEEL